MVFYNHTASKDQLVIKDNTGNVIINNGTTDAGYKLDVNGTARVQGNIATRAAIIPSPTNSSTDYIFIGKGGSLAADITTSACTTSLNMNVYYNGSSLQRLFTGFSSTIGLLDNGNVQIGTAPSGSGSPTITTRLHINNTGEIGIGTSSPNASALLDVSSTTKGFLPPRMTNAQMVAIATPAAGLVVYDTTNNKLNVYDGTNWVTLH